MIIFIQLLLAAGVGVAVAIAGKETVPYSGRRQLLFATSNAEANSGAAHVEAIKKSRIVLCRWHWDSIRARRVADRLLRAMEKGLEDVDSRSMSISTKQFLKGLKWEVLVVKPPQLDFNARHVGGGKILIGASLLHRFERDDEIATIIGHEMGHCIARHNSEAIALILLMIISGILVFLSVPWMLFPCFITFARYALWLPFSRRLEKEADYIGLLLMAQAGFNPQVAPSVYNRFYTAEKKWEAYGSTHPTGKERAETLSQDHVMSEATKIYEKKKPVSWYSKIYKFFI